MTLSSSLKILHLMAEEQVGMSIVSPQSDSEFSEGQIQPNLLGVRIASLGMFVPSQVVTNEDLANLGCDSDWIVQRTGILSRRHASAAEATSDLAIAAAQDCLDKAGVGAQDVDLIIVATMTPDHYTPSTSCLVQAKLGATCGAFDLNAACSGFLYGLITGSHFVKLGLHKNVLVIGAEKMSCVCDPEDKKTFPLFGDGAGAALLQPDPNPDESAVSGILACRLASVGELADSLVVPGGGSRQPACEAVVANRDQFLKMEGRTVFKWAVRLIPEVVKETLAKAGMELKDVDLLVLHQANERILKAATDDLQIDENRVFVNLANYGNTSAASIPISLFEAERDGRIKRGDVVMLTGFGAGLTWATCLMRW